MTDERAELIKKAVDDVAKSTEQGLSPEFVQDVSKLLRMGNKQQDLEAIQQLNQAIQSNEAARKVLGNSVLIVGESNEWTITAKQQVVTELTYADGKPALKLSAGQQQPPGELQIAANGDMTRTVTANDGSKLVSTYKKEGTTIQRDGNNALLAVAGIRDGREEPILIVDGAKTIVSNGNGRRWVQEGATIKEEVAPGQAAAREATSLTTDANGNVTVKLNDGGTELFLPSGVIVKSNHDGTKSEVEYPDGSKRSFDRDAAGGAKYTEPDGSYWQFKDGAYSKFDKNNAAVADAPGQPSKMAKVWLSPMGDQQFEGTDGRKIYNKTNGSQIQVRPDGDVDKVVYPDGSYRTFAHDADSRKLSIVNISDGRSAPKPDTAFVDPPGGSVDAGGVFHARRRDGGTLDFHPTGAAVLTDKDSKVTAVQDARRAVNVPVMEPISAGADGAAAPVQGSVQRTPGGDGGAQGGSPERPTPATASGDGTARRRREIQFKPDGSAEYKVKDGDTLWSIARDVLRHQRPELTKPTVAQIEAEIERIRAHSEIADAGKIYADRTLVKIPPKDAPAAPAPAGGPPRTDAPVERPAQAQPRVTDAPPQPAEHNDEPFKAEENVYHPVRPPGLGNVYAGKPIDNPEEAGDSGIHDRVTTKHLQQGDKTDYEYEGTLADDDNADARTKFKARETYNHAGKIIASSALYEPPTSLTFKDKDGSETTIDGVRQIETKMTGEGRYETVVTSADNKTVVFKVNADGTIGDAPAATTETSGEAGGAGSADEVEIYDTIGRNAAVFIGNDDAYSAVRPIGMAEGDVGEPLERDDVKRQAEVKGDGKAKTFAYKGVIIDKASEDSATEDAAIETGFSASESYDSEGKLVISAIEYDEPRTIPFQTPENKFTEITAVKRVQTVRKDDGYESNVVTADGRLFAFRVNADGTVKSVAESRAPENRR